MHGLRSALARTIGVLLLALLMGCSSSSGPSVPGSGNLFANASFEEGAEPWFSLTTSGWGTPFQVSEAEAHSGKSSAYLEVRSTGAPELQVFGVVQEATPQSFPARLSGYYRVDRWVRGSKVQYVQVAAIAIGTDLPGGYSNHQIRYLLAGIQEEPFEITNARFVFVTREEPVLGEWVRFDLPLADDFARLWGAVPGRFEKLRFLFEGRYEQREPGQPEVVADVYFDDLYLGP